MITYSTFAEQFLTKSIKCSIPSKKDLKSNLLDTIKTLQSYDENIRPLDKEGKTGALLQFDDDKPTIIVPDLHARPSFLIGLFKNQIPDDFLNDDIKQEIIAKINLQNKTKKNSLTVFECLQNKIIRVICLGDALHSEVRGKDRWREAYSDFVNFHYTGKAMTTEMSEGLTLVDIIMKSICLFPGYFFFLKGNHENILNQEGNGNHQFRKFALEGVMTTSFMIKTYGKTITKLYANFEKLLPLFVKTPFFLASHTEPKKSFSVDQLINAYNSIETIEGLTWIANGEAEENSASEMLRNLIPDNDFAFYFGGHRPVREGLYTLRCNNKYIQLHNPTKQAVAFIPTDRPFSPDSDIKEIQSEIL